MNPNGILINTTQPVKKIRHIAYYVNLLIDDGRETCVLNEVIEATYPHPDAPEEANISRIEDREVGRFTKSSHHYHSLVVAYHANKAIRLDNV